MEAAVDLVCALTLNRSCPLLCNTAVGKWERWHEKFEVPATPEKVAEFSHWRV